MPYELVDLLEAERIDKVILTGAKASGSIQATCQLLVDKCIEISIVKECVEDDNQERLKATFDHLLPIYGNILSLNELINDIGGADILSPDSKDLLVDLMSGGTGYRKATDYYASDCGRRGHGKRFIEILIERGDWKIYPTQIWYEDFVQGEYHCPLAKKVVDFCDEPNFSKVAMFIKGKLNKWDANLFQKIYLSHDC